VSKFMIHGFPVSPFVRSVCVALEEKGLHYEVQPLAGGIGSDAHRRLHPFARIPTVDHRGYRLYETQAILRYIDAKFPDPPLQPTDPEAIGRMSQIMGINDCYLFPQVARIIVFQRIMGPALMGLTPDEAVIAAAVPDAKRCFAELNGLLAGQPFLAGDRFSLADVLLAPQLSLLAATPEGARLLEGTALSDWLGRMSERPSMQATVPPKELKLSRAA
jgi:glutathione S-transferase